MKYNLIMLPNPILVSDEVPCTGNLCYYPELEILPFDNSEIFEKDRCHKIIAGIPNLPTFKSAQSLRKGFSEEDVIEFLEWTKKEDIEKNAEKYFHYSNLDMLQLWKQSRHPIDYEVELEMEVSYCQNHFNETEEMITKPKLTNNSYTITKIIK